MSIIVIIVVLLLPAALREAQDAGI